MYFLKKTICVIGLGLLGKPGCRKILVNTLNVLLSLFLLNILDFELGDIESKRKNVFLGYKNVFYLIWNIFYLYVLHLSQWHLRWIP